MAFDHARFVHAVAERTGLDPQQAETAVVSTFEAIGRALPQPALAEVAGLLPPELGAHLQSGAATPASGGLLSDLADHEHVSLGFAKEHAQVILEQLASLQDENARERLREALAEHLPEAAQWLVPWRAPPEHVGHRHPVDDRSLAGGRPGSRNPVSESAPDRGQHDSPAVTTDPHAETRLSSSHGVSTEREHTSVAEGQPGSAHPIRDKQD